VLYYALPGQRGKSVDITLLDLNWVQNRCQVDAHQNILDKKKFSYSRSPATYTGDKICKPVPVDHADTRSTIVSGNPWSTGCTVTRELSYRATAFFDSFSEMKIETILFI